MPLSQAGILDTGPSGMTTAIGAWLLARRHAYATLALLMTALTVGRIAGAYRGQGQASISNLSTFTHT